MTDFFVAGSWRNRDAIADVVAVLDDVGASAYCFIRAKYPQGAAVLAAPGGADEVRLDDPGVQDLFEQDLEALRSARQFLLVLPAGAAAHVEAGIAYGLGKPCYAIGPVERSETLYRIFRRVFADTGALRRSLPDAPNGGSR